MRIAFIGAVDFSRHCLEELIRLGADICTVVTPSAASARFNSDYVDLGSVAAASSIPVCYVDTINAPETIAALRDLAPDVLFVFGFSQMIGSEILAIPPRGAIGTHPALLPRHRGRHPLIWALIEELPETGLTFFYLDEGPDSGDILWQRAFPIEPEDDAGSLYAKVKAAAVDGIREWLPHLEAGTAPRIPQDPSLATYWRKRSPRDGEIDWTGPARRAHNLVRALTRPYPGAQTASGSDTLTVWRTELGDAAPGPVRPGLVVAGSGKGLTVLAADRALTLVEWECTGRSPRPGMLLGSVPQ